MNNENYLAVAKKHAGGNGNLTINFAWPKGIAIVAGFSLAGTVCVNGKRVALIKDLGMFSL